MVPNATQTQPEEEIVKPIPVTVEASIQTVETRQEERGIQTEVSVDKVDVLVEAMERKKNRKKGKGKERRKDDDTVMKDGSGDLTTDRYREYEDLSSYEEEDETLVPEPPAKEKQAARRPAAKAEKKSQPAKKPLRRPSPKNDTLVKALVVHGIPCQRPLAELVQDVGPGGIMGARWLLGGARRLGKTTSSVVIFFDKKLALGTHLKVKGDGTRSTLTILTEEGGGLKLVIGKGNPDYGLHVIFLPCHYFTRFFITQFGPGRIQCVCR